MTMKAKLFHADVLCVDQVTKRQTRSSERISERGQTMFHHLLWLIEAADINNQV